MSKHTTRMTPEFEQRLHDQQAERNDLHRDLKQKYLKPEVPWHISQRVFDKAWEDGHADGTYAVEQAYDDLSEIVNAAFKAGINHANENR